MKQKYRFFSLVVCALLYQVSSPAAADTAEIQLKSLADRYQTALLHSGQPFAYFSDLPLTRHDRFLDNTPEGLQTLQKTIDDVLDKLRTLQLTESDQQVFYAKFVEALETSVQQRICRSELWNISHMFGPHSLLDFLINVQPVATVQDRQDALSRWNQAADYYEQEIINLKTGLSLGYSAPKRVVRRLISQLQALTAIELNAHPYMRLAERADNAEFSRQFSELIRNRLLPAMRSYNEFLLSEYLPQAREPLGIHALPDGRDCYIAQYRSYTTLQRTPEEVFELGLKTVNANKARVVELAKQLYSEASFDGAVKKANEDASQKFADGNAMHEFFVTVNSRAEAAMPQYFSQMPTIELQVEAIPEYQQGTGRSAHYVSGNQERAAKFAYDPTTFDQENHGTAEIVTVHEGYPGHHLQIALVQDQAKFHPIERTFSNSAFAEGWARYAEALAEEAGIYQSKSARILRRAWPARGMVADPALHMLGWSNQQVADFLIESGASFTKDVDVMLDRIAALPAQLTAYDSGALEIFALREQMEAALGDDFDIKMFHQLMLKNGNVPIAVLRQQVTQALQSNQTAE